MKPNFNKFCCILWFVSTTLIGVGLGAQIHLYTSNYSFWDLLTLDSNPQPLSCLWKRVSSQLKSLLSRTQEQWPREKIPNVSTRWAYHLFKIVMKVLNLTRNRTSLEGKAAAANNVISAADDNLKKCHQNC